ncbi:MAG: TetR/AcrR family transcriptional regulator [Myxococcota bacterium]
MASETSEKPTRGHKKKARTRRRLIEAGVKSYGAFGAAMTVQHVVAEADVSHGTFYNYFEDLDALVEAVAVDVITELGEAVASAGHADPAQRFATASLQTLILLGRRTEFARVILRLVTRGDREQGFTMNLRADLAEGQASGRFRAFPDELAEDAVYGMLVVSLHRMVVGRWSEDRARLIVEHLLKVLGVPAAEAAELVANASASLPPPT